MQNVSLPRAYLGGALVSIAMRYDGVREEPRGSNRGPMVEKFQAVTILAKKDRTGWPWCAAFMAFIFKELWKELGIQTPCFFPMTASCDELLRWARDKKILHTTPQKYDVFLSINPKNENDAVHTGLVSVVQSDGEIETIEGNTNTAGSREGIGVFVFKGGSAKSPKGRVYIRWLDLLPPNVKLLPPANTPLLAQFKAAPKPAPSPSIAKATPRPASKPVPKPPRLILAFAPYNETDYHAVQSARLENNSWVVDGGEIAGFLALYGVMMSQGVTLGRGKLRDYLKMANVTLDELRVRLGNHLGDEANPRQYAFLKLPASNTVVQE
ncbi:hypothetical protein EON83_10885 [bacterium]|nr:MAG: hypothetical protein EON83_10885 [bacterium]